MTETPTGPVRKSDVEGFSRRGLSGWWRGRHALACACAASDGRVALLERVGAWAVTAGAALAGIGALKAVIAGSNIMSRDVSDVMSGALIPGTVAAAATALLVMLAIVLLVSIAFEPGER